MLKVEHLTIQETKQGRYFFKDLSFSLGPEDKLALIGEEGNGKSTLLRVLQGERPAYLEVSGSIHKDGASAYMEQEGKSVYREMTLLDFLLRRNAETPIEAEDYALLAQLDKKTAELKLEPSAVSLDKRIVDFSGGEMIKLSLLKALLRDPSLLFLDEPSNDLDLDSLTYLTSFLIHCPLPVVFVSHDERLLSDVSTMTLELVQKKKKSEGEAFFSALPYLAYVAEKERKRQKDRQVGERQRQDYDEKMTRFRQIYQRVETDQRNCPRADPSTGRLLKKHMHLLKSEKRRLDKEKTEFIPLPEEERSLTLFFPENVLLPKNKRVTIDIPSLSIASRRLSAAIHLSFLGPRKIAIVGANGVGKTTLLKEIRSRLLLQEGLKVGYMPQNYDEALSLDFPSYRNLVDTQDLKKQRELKTLLGAELFTGAEMEHPVRSLSGGQKAKLLLLKMVVEEDNICLLDEPTRNLTPESVHQIITMFTAYHGAILAVSHDRLFLDSVFEERYELSKDGLQKK